MAKSSIHIAGGNSGYLKHNDRSKHTENVIFDDEQNEINNNSDEAFKIYRSELKTRTEAYLKNHPTRKKLHSKTLTHLSAIVNFNKDHTMDDLQKVAKYLEDTLDTKVFQIAMHKDEGHIDEDGNAIKNYHAHIEFMGLDSTGASVRRKLDRKYLIELQDKVAELLKMERGINYTKEQKPRPKRLDTYEFKEMKKKETAAKLAKQKDLKAEIASLREQLKEQGANRSDYAELEQLSRELKAKIKAKDLTIAEMQKSIQKIQNEVKSLKSENETLRELDEKRQKEIEAYQTLTKSLKNDLRLLENKNKANFGLNQDIKNQISQLQRQISDYEGVLGDIADSVNYQGDDLDDLVSSIKSLSKQQGEASYQHVRECLDSLNSTENEMISKIALDLSRNKLPVDVINGSYSPNTSKKRNRLT